MIAARVLELKAQAKQLKTELGLKHAAALTLIAQREGFNSWDALVASAGGSDAVREAKLDLRPGNAQERRADRAQRFGGVVA